MSEIEGAARRAESRRDFLSVMPPTPRRPAVKADSFVCQRTLFFGNLGQHGRVGLQCSRETLTVRK